jgi:hypothetical protein
MVRPALSLGMGPAYPVLVGTEEDFSTYFEIICNCRTYSLEKLHSCNLKICDSVSIEIMQVTFFSVTVIFAFLIP